MDYSEIRIFHAFLLAAYDAGLSPEVIAFCQDLPASIAAIHDREMAGVESDGQLAWEIHKWLTEEG